MKKIKKKNKKKEPRKQKTAKITKKQKNPRKKEISSPVTTLQKTTVTSPPEMKVGSVLPIVEKKKNYLNNRDLLAQVMLSKKQERMTNELAKMLQMLCRRYARKGNFVNYTYNDDMQAYAMLMLVRTWNSFDPKKSNNPFAFFTQCIKHSFIQYLNQEKKQRDVRDELMLKAGLSPSFSYVLDQAERELVNEGCENDEQNNSHGDSTFGADHETSKIDNQSKTTEEQKLPNNLVEY